MRLGHPARALIAGLLLLICAYQALLALIGNTQHPALSGFLAFYLWAGLALLALYALTRICYRWESTKEVRA